MATYYGGQLYTSEGGSTQVFNGNTITGAKIMNGTWVGMFNGSPWSAAPGVEPDAPEPIGDPYAVPTPLAGESGSLLPSSTDATMIAHTPDNVTHPSLVVYDAPGGGTTSAQVLPPETAIPAWMWIVGLAIVALLLSRHK